jgi:hypothetical protein
MSIIKKCINYIKQKRSTIPKLTVRTLPKYCMGGGSNRSNKKLHWLDTFVDAFIRSEWVFFTTFDSCLKNKDEKAFSFIYWRGG